MKPRKFLAKEKNGTSKAKVEGKGEKPNDECHFKAKNLLSAHARTLEASGSVSVNGSAIRFRSL